MKKNTLITAAAVIGGVYALSRMSRPIQMNVEGLGKEVQPTPEELSAFFKQSSMSTMEYNPKVNVRITWKPGSQEAVQYPNGQTIAMTANEFNNHYLQVYRNNPLVQSLEITTPGVGRQAPQTKIVYEAPLNLNERIQMVPENQMSPAPLSQSQPSMLPWLIGGGVAASLALFLLVK